MRADGRFGGHFVQGHVDGVGTVRDDPAGGRRPLADRRVSAARWRRSSSRKGSIAVDGVSLTVAALGDDQFDVMIIPFTWAHTSLPRCRSARQVNLECDMVGKYVARAVELFGSA